MQDPAFNRERLIGGIESGKLLPSLSPLTLRLIEIASDEESSLSDIGALIQKDPALTIRVLRLANSVFFRFGNPAKSVQQAVVRIGTRQTRLLALSLILKDTFPLGKVGASDYRRFWRLSLYQGLAAQALARKIGIRDADEAFTAAFTLEIGLLALLHAFSDRPEAAGVPWYPLSSLLDWERETYGLDHREIGELILTRWKFPASFIVCQKSAFLNLKVDELLPLVRICTMASQLSAFICEPEAHLPEIFDTLEFRFGLSKQLIHEVVGSSLQQVDEAAETFELQVESERDTDALMEKARLLLAHLSGKLNEQQQPLPGGASSPAAVHHTAKVARRPALEDVEREIRGPLVSVGGLVRTLARSVDPASDQGRCMQALLAETARLEEAVKRLDRMLD